MINLHRLITKLFPDRRPQQEKKREREFIQAANSLKTLKVTPEGGMSIDPEELREQIVASREQLKHLVHKTGAPRRPFEAATDFLAEQGAIPSVATPVSALDCIEVVAWRRLHSGAAVRYMCLQSTSTGRFAVVTASLFSDGAHSLPSWIEANTAKHVANAIQNDHLRWLATVSEAMDAWDADL
ncbi:hypothetical protein V2K54_12280 [Pseudomonas alliivorans]|uniref:Uncharacterized protein n=1 Tax=Pseudomonas alliivorans TaxID=2810613 RepID=A0ABS4CB60_9PSED|nr:hypothetical protein [Pseudomonas alliivorans]MBP0947506.1 hypothetical protein [Pseudomonas alliivorans]MEE4328045.1 hypothetical protein [Pseudomonas alliivorans]MEE4335965.1 hypothetical protein [Pseudomonas alliivorans]MEE4369808.1 hypothetical protein [Pseudomonas alliivorans]MEE4957557.1 hypothetical protein [Pseudomonas alliivorans]